MSQTDTPCKNCVFATYKGITQTGCSLDKIEMHRKNGIEIIEGFDEDKEFFILKNKRCVFARSQEWVHKDKPVEEQIKLMDKEIFPYNIIIINTDSSLDKLMTTLNSVYGQDLLPYHVSIVNRSGLSTEHDRYIIGVLESHRIPWKLKHMSDPEIPDCKFTDSIIDFMPTYYHSVFYSGFEIPSDTFSTIKDKIANENLMFAALLPNTDNQGWTVPTIIHKMYGGNKHKPLIDKLREEKCQMTPITEVLPNFPK